MADPERPQQAGSIAERISEEIAAIHEESYGRPAKAVKTYLLDDAVVSVIELELLRHEQLVVDNGNHPSVREIRKAFQEAIGATFKASVEHMTGRRVIGFVSDTHLDPPFSVEFFKLRPAEKSADDPRGPGIA
jgi:uncharacterized protein YbcI